MSTISEMYPRSMSGRLVHQRRLLDIQLEHIPFPMRQPDQFVSRNHWATRVSLASILGGKEGTGAFHSPSTNNSFGSGSWGSGGQFNGANSGVFRYALLQLHDSDVIGVGLAIV
uniref:Uncharacterized protein n=1 Tax=Megaselia scalaris TaxID=36166 RepID=T1GRG7_MEGSC